MVFGVQQAHLIESKIWQSDWTRYCHGCREMGWIKKDIKTTSGDCIDDLRQQGL